MCISACSPAVLSSTLTVPVAGHPRQRWVWTAATVYAVLLMREHLTGIHQTLCQHTKRHTVSVSHCSKETCGLKDKVTEKEICGAGERVEQISSKSYKFPFGLCLSAVKWPYLTTLRLCSTVCAHAKQIQAIADWLVLARLTYKRAGRKSSQTSREWGDRSQEPVIEWWWKHTAEQTRIYLANRQRGDGMWRGVM